MFDKIITTLTAVTPGKITIGLGLKLLLFMIECNCWSYAVVVCTERETDLEDVSIVSQWDNSVCDSAGDEIGISIVHCCPIQFPCISFVLSLCN